MGRDDNDLRKNGSGYNDPTAYHAIKHVMSDEARAMELIKSIKALIRLAGFEPMNRICIKDTTNGKEYT